MWLIALATAAEWTVELGADVTPSPHLVGTFAVREASWQAGLYTDTVDLRWTPSWEYGRGWVAARGQFGAAGLMISPWTDGAPSDGVRASYVGLEGGILRYLPRGFYAGGQMVGRRWFFSDTYTDRWIGTADGLLGYWRSSDVNGWGRVGVDIWGPVSPHAQVQFMARPSWTWSPRAAVWAGWASGQDDVTRTRVGGLNPWVVPLAGAGWSEFWVEDYAALRSGGGFNGERLRVDAVVDLVVADGWTAVGFALDGTVSIREWEADLAIGYAPWIQRQPGVARTTAWVLLRRPWG